MWSRNFSSGGLKPRSLDPQRIHLVEGSPELKFRRHTEQSDPEQFTPGKVWMWSRNFSSGGLKPRSLDPQRILVEGSPELKFRRHTEQSDLEQFAPGKV